MPFVTEPLPCQMTWVYVSTMKKPDHLPQSDQLSDDQLEPIVGGLASSRVRPTAEEANNIMIDKYKALGISVDASDLKDPRKLSNPFRG